MEKKYMSLVVLRVSNGYIYRCQRQDGGFDEYVKSLAKAPDMKSLRDQLVWDEELLPPEPPEEYREKSDLGGEDEVVEV